MSLGRFESPPVARNRGLFYTSRIASGGAPYKERAMSWNKALEQAEKMQIEGPTPDRVHAWADAIREALR